MNNEIINNANKDFWEGKGRSNNFCVSNENLLIGHIVFYVSFLLFQSPSTNRFITCTKILFLMFKLVAFVIGPIMGSIKRTFIF